MKRKVLLLTFAIILILTLIGCKTTPPVNGCPEWMRAEDFVYNYWIAMINRQYELTKHYCITDGVWYNKTDEWEEYINTNSEGEASVLVYLPHFYEQAVVTGYNAIVYAQIHVEIIAFPGSNISGGDVFEYEIDLIKQNYPPGDWELK